MFRTSSLILLVLFVLAPAPAPADPGFPTGVTAEPSWPDGPSGTFRPVQPVAGDTYWVDGTNGSPTGDGTEGDPVDTISRGLELAGAGDTVMVKSGTYHEQVIVPDKNPAPSRSRPLTLKAEPIGTPAVIDGTGVTPVTEGTLQNAAGVSMYRDGVSVLDGFEIRNWSGYGAAVQQSSDAVVTNCLFEDNGTGMADSVDLVVISSRDVKVVGNLFTSDTERALDDRATDTWIVYNFFAGHLANAIKVGPHPAGQGSRVEFNAFEDNPAIQGVIYVHEARGVTVQRNLLVRGNYQGIRLDDVEDTMALLNTVTGFQVGLEIYRLTGCRLEGNILAGNTLGVEILSLMADSGLDANLYHDNTADVDGQGEAGPHAMFEDPGFEDPGADIYALVDGAYAVDKGPEDLPVPVGGGTRTDLGAFEKGAGLAPWDYQPGDTVADFTPAFLWTYTNREPADTQGSYRVQVDAVSTFDSEDLVDSNWVSSADSTWTLPKGFDLAAGDWYVRIKTQDTANLPGPWSDPHVRLTVEAPPTCAAQSGTGCDTLDACDGDWLVAVDHERCCLGSCVACPDGDQDGFLDSTCGGGDCDDTNDAIHPDAEEDCGDSVDNDCDQTTDLEDADCGCVDHDRDGYGENCAAGPDCDDAIASVHPGAEELCNNVDDDCDDLTDEGYDLQIDPDNCGECGWACRSTEVCDLGQCDTECGTGRSDCDRSCIDTSGDLDNCGGCGQVCDRPHASEKCEGGQCIMTLCEEGWVNLNASEDDGCEYECTLSGEEVCDNGQDDNCDGQVDEDCGAGGCGCATRDRPVLSWLALLAGLWIACRRSRSPAHAG